ncbi:hypothetical protein L484_005295 [Morus notabilis]|uniref:Pentatricopeptide repeat-containing protein n=1 Tax=Morus notabilis TaxID=981085 RepID=W9QMU1_9ROSA|nr:hypothetical protein L484_005295 [Morus notabilis]
MATSSLFVLRLSLIPSPNHFFPPSNLHKIFQLSSPFLTFRTSTFGFKRLIPLAAASASFSAGSGCLGTLQIQEAYRCPNKEPVSSDSISDSFLSEKILLGLKQGNLISVHNYIYRINPLVVVEVLSCCENLQLSVKFVDLILLNCPHMRHSSQSLSVMIHVLVRGRRLSEAQVLVLRMVRRSGISRFDVVESLVSTYHSGCGSNTLVFDLLVRTYVQAKKLREV